MEVREELDVDLVVDGPLVLRGNLRGLRCAKVRMKEIVAKCNYVRKKLSDCICSSTFLCSVSIAVSTGAESTRSYAVGTEYKSELSYTKILLKSNVPLRGS